MCVSTMTNDGGLRNVFQSADLVYNQLVVMDQAKRILSDFDRRTIADIFTAMENHKPLTRSYMDANTTFRKWASRDADRKADKNPPKKGGTFVKPKTI